MPTTQLLGPDTLRLQPIIMATQVAPGESKTLRYKVLNDATVTSLRIIIPTGPNYTLQIVPYVVNARGQRTDLVTYVEGGKDYIDGDGVDLPFAVSVPVAAKSDTELRVQFTNTDTANTYDAFVSMSLDYSNGQYPGVNSSGR